MIKLDISNNQIVPKALKGGGWTHNPDAYWKYVHENGKKTDSRPDGVEFGTDMSGVIALSQAIKESWVLRDDHSVTDVRFWSTAPWDLWISSATTSVKSKRAILCRSWMQAILSRRSAGLLAQKPSLIYLAEISVRPVLVLWPMKWSSIARWYHWILRTIIWALMAPRCFLEFYQSASKLQKPYKLNIFHLNRFLMRWDVYVPPWSTAVWWNWKSTHLSCRFKRSRLLRSSICRTRISVPWTQLLLPPYYHWPGEADLVVVHSIVLMSCPGPIAVWPAWISRRIASALMEPRCSLESYQSASKSQRNHISFIFHLNRFLMRSDVHVLPCSIALWEHWIFRTTSWRKASICMTLLMRPTCLAWLRWLVLSKIRK